jgi:hypothetical protein
MVSEHDLHCVWKRWAYLYWSTSCTEKVGVSMLAYIVNEKGGRVYVDLHGVGRVYVGLHGVWR